MRAVACPVVRGVVAPHGLDAHRKSRDASAAVRPARRGAMSSPRRARCAPAVAADGASAASASSTPAPFTRADLDLLLRAVELSAGSDGLTQPHPKSGCVLAAADGAVVAEATVRQLIIDKSRHKLCPRGRTSVVVLWTAASWSSPHTSTEGDWLK